MGKTKKSKDITKTGALTYKDLQELNDLNPSTNVTAVDLFKFMQDNKMVGSQQALNAIYSQNANISDQLVQSSLLGQKTRTDGQDYWGNSHFDDDVIVGEQDWDRLSDVRAENQPWYSKLANGIGKAGILAATTALETAGLLYGAGHSLLESVGAIEDDNKNFLQDMWDNPITNALHNLNELSEEYMPNYYSKDEMENPWGNIFTANFLGDKLLKNFGFMVGAFYGGIPLSKAIGAAGKALVRSTRAATQAERAGMLQRVGELTSKYGDDATELEKMLSAEHLTEAERGERFIKGIDKVKDIAKTTRATAQTLGALGSALNEGAIEAINNSKDWANKMRQEADTKYQQRLQEIEELYGGTSKEIEEKVKEAEKHERELAAIEEGRASVGNADMLMNIPILLASNVIQLGRLYTRGFDSTRRQLGTFWDGHKLGGSLAKHTLESNRTKKGAILSALTKSNTEGLEEFLQRTAQDASGNTISNAIDDYLRNGTSIEDKADVDDYIASFGKAFAKNLGDPQAWEEYMIGAVSSAIGMPVFGSQTRNAYVGKDKAIGLAGGFIGNYRDYMDAKKRETDIANYLNERVQKPEFKALYEGLIRHNDLDKRIKQFYAQGDKKNAKDTELLQLMEDINKAASSGHLEEFKQLIGYNTEYTPEELASIVEQTTYTVSAKQQEDEDKNKQQDLEKQIRNIDETLKEYTGERESSRKTKLNAREQEAWVVKDKLEREKAEVLSQEDSEEKDAKLRELDDRIAEQNDIIDDVEKRINSYTALYNNTEEAAEKKAELKALKSELQKELNEVKDRLNEGYKDKTEGPFIRNINGRAIGMDTIPIVNEDGTVVEGSEGQEMREILERNRVDLLNKINNFVKIRNDIDIESDGQLDDKNIQFLTALKAKVLDYEERSTEMVEDLISSLPRLNDNLEAWTKRAQTDIDSAKEFHDRAKKRLEEAKQDNAKASRLEALEKNVVAAKEALDKAEDFKKEVNNVIDFIKLLTEKKDSTVAERVARRKGYGHNRLRRLAGIFHLEARNINSDEAQAYFLSNPLHVKSLYQFLLSNLSGLDIKTKERLLTELVDLSTIAFEKKIYNDNIREFIGDKSKLNEAFRQSRDRLTQEEIDNKAETLALRIKSVHSMSELDKIYREAYGLDPRIAEAAMKKAKETSDEGLKNFISEYEELDKFNIEFFKQVSTLPEESKRRIYEAIYGGNQLSEDNLTQNAWDYALSNGNGKEKQVYIEKLNEIANDLSKSIAPGEKDAGEAMKKILKDLDAAVKSTTTNNVKEKPSTNKSNKGKNKINRDEKSDDADKKGVKGFDALMKKQQQMKKSAKKEEPEDTKDDLLKLISSEINASIGEDGTSSIVDISKLSKELQERIEKYNSLVTVDNQIKDFHILHILQNIIDEKVNNAQQEDKEGNTEEFENERSAEMKQNVSESFTSDFPSQYEFYLPGVQEFADYRIPYEAQDDQAKAVQRLLQEYKAYQFVDKNYLGYVYKINSSIPIHYLKSTNDEINNGEKGITFLAIEYTDDVEKAIKKYAFNNNESVNLQEEVKLVEINGKKYQIVGVLSFSSERASKETRDAYRDLQAKLNTELAPQIADAKEKGQEFVLSELTNKIKTIYTGRLEKRNNENDDKKKVSLYDYMATSQGSDSRRASTEWEYGSNFYFGVMVNHMLEISDSAPDDLVEPGLQWSEKGENDGAILLFVPKADGKFYPIFVTRKTVSDWLSTIVDGQHKGEELLDSVIDNVLEGKPTNEYLGDIVKLMYKLFDPDTNFGERIHTKQKLSKFFIFKSSSPIHIDEITGDVDIVFNNDEGAPTRVTITGENPKEMIQQLFSILAEHDIKFTLPSPTMKEGQFSSGRDIITSGVFEVGLRGFYNFNANFTIYSTDADGKPIYEKPVGDNTEGSDFTGNDNIRGQERKVDLGDGVKTYYIDGDNVLDENGEDTLTDDQKNLVRIGDWAKDGNLPTYIQERARKNEHNDFASSNPKFAKIYVYHAEGDEIWLYDANEPTHTKSLFKESSPRGQAIKNEFIQRLSEYRSKKQDVILQKPKTSKVTVNLIADGILNTTDEERGLFIAEVNGDKFTFYPTASIAKFAGASDQSSTMGIASIQWRNAVSYTVEEPGTGHIKDGAYVIDKPAKVKINYDSNPPAPNPSKKVVGNSRILLGHKLEDFTSDGDSLPSVLLRASQVPKTKTLILGNKKKGTRGIFGDLQELEKLGVDMNNPDILSNIKRILAIDDSKKRNAEWETYYVIQIKGCKV